MVSKWFPAPVWDGLPAYVVGGGHSLREFSWENLIGRNVVGTNIMFYYGHDLVPVCVAGDAKFLMNPKHQRGIQDYVAAGGIMVTNTNRFKANPPPYLRVMKRKLHGLSTDGLGWNGNTGSLAINLALLFAANPIYLIGFDMNIGKDGKSNFHNGYAKNTDEKTYQRFIKGMSFLNKDLKRLFPDREVINLEDDTSSLDVFPKQSLKAHFESKEK